MNLHEGRNVKHVFTYYYYGGCNDEKYRYGF